MSLAAWIIVLNVAFREQNGQILSHGAALNCSLILTYDGRGCRLLFVCGEKENCVSSFSYVFRLTAFAGTN